MNKEINEFDRMIIGVREWAVGEALRRIENPVSSEVTKYAKELEKYVLRGIKEKS